MHRDAETRHAFSAHQVGLSNIAMQLLFTTKMTLSLGGGNLGAVGTETRSFR